MIGKYHDDILAIISRNGAMGVNALQRELNIPLSTLQKYLHKQTYFRMNDERKWDLPENITSDIKSNTLSLTINVVENSILMLQSQLDEMKQSIANALAPIGTLKRGIDNLAPTPVAGKATPLDKRLSNLNDAALQYKVIVRKQKDIIPDQYLNLLINLDYVGLVFSLGAVYADEMLTGDIYGVLVGSITELSDDLLDVIKENQMEA